MEEEEYNYSFSRSTFFEYVTRSVVPAVVLLLLLPRIKATMIIIRTAAPTIQTHGSTVVVSVVTDLLDLVVVDVLALSWALTIKEVNVRNRIADTCFKLIDLVRISI